MIDRAHTASATARTTLRGLGIDAGGTATRWHLTGNTDHAPAAGTGPPLSGHVFSDDVRAGTRIKLAALATDVLRVGRPDAIAAGITGLDAGTDAAHFYRDCLADLFALSPAVVRIENDMAIAVRAATDPGAGILVYSGTGSVACHLTTDQQLIRVGGRGVIIDDGGSGFWIAKEAVKLLFRAEDTQPGSGWATPLGTHLARGFGGPTWTAARTAIYGSDRGNVAKLARFVADAANEGDTNAIAIFDAAGRELASLASALINRLGRRDVILAGGATTLHRALPDAVVRSLANAATVTHRPLLDSAAAAAVRANFLLETSSASGHAT